MKRVPVREAPGETNYPRIVINGVEQTQSAIYPMFEQHSAPPPKFNKSSGPRPKLPLVGNVR
jgi:hypothetical protein